MLRDDSGCSVDGNVLIIAFGATLNDDDDDDDAVDVGVRGIRYTWLNNYYAKTSSARNIR